VSNRDLRLETARLILRPPQRDDLDAWAEFMSDADAVRFIGGRHLAPSRGARS
jgi:RimJ/RimL family protein N-acetyltransferase